MKCPHCKNEKTYVTKIISGKKDIRYRKCPVCKKSFKAIEEVLTKDEPAENELSTEELLDLLDFVKKTLNNNRDKKLIDNAVKSVKDLEHVKNLRPCEICKHKKKGMCELWACGFEVIE